MIFSVLMHQPIGVFPTLVKTRKKNENQSLQGNYYNPCMYNDWIIRVNPIQISIGDIPIRN